MYTPPDLIHRSSHILAATVISFWLLVHESFAQFHVRAFGQFHELALTEQFERLLLSREAERGHKLWLWTPGSTRLAAALLDSTLHVISLWNHIAPHAFDDITLADIDGNGATDLILLHRGTRRLSVVLNPVSDTLRPANVLNLPVEPTGIAVADLNNDRRVDLLIFDRQTPGILPFIGLGRGKFRQGKVIAPDNTVGNIVPIHLNNDDIVDLVLYDWVTNELHLLYGIGLAEFFDQVTLPLSGELRDLRAVHFARQRPVDLVLRYEKPPLVEVWEGDGFGDFRAKMRIPIRETSVALALEDVNNDGLKDFVLLDRSAGLQVFINMDEESPAARLDFSAGSDPRAIVLRDLDGDGLIDALLLDRSARRLLIYRNAERRTVLDDSLELVSGINPRAVQIADADGDGLNDLALVNEGSASLSLFINRSDHGIAGQTGFRLNPGPRYLAYHSSFDSTARFLVSYPAFNQISHLTIDFKDRTVTNAVILTAGEAEFLSWSGFDRRNIDFFCYNSSLTAGSPSLAYFQQLGPQRFIERSFRLAIPDALTGAAVADVNGDGFPDVIYLYRNVATNVYELAVSLGDSALSFKQRSFSHEMPENVVRRSSFWVEDFNGDGIPDILMSLPEHSRLLKLARGLGAGSFSPPDTVAGDIRLTDRSQLQIADLDGDGVPDLLLNNAERGAIVWLRGKGDGSFEASQTLVAEPHIGHFALGDLNNDGIPDLAYSLREKGTVKLIDGRRFRRITNGHPE